MAGGAGAAGPTLDVRHQPPGYPDLLPYTTGYPCLCRDIIVYLWLNKVSDHELQGEHEESLPVRIFILSPVSFAFSLLLMYVIEVGSILGTNGDHGGICHNSG